MNIDEQKRKYEKIKEVALKNRDKLTNEQIKVLKDLVEQNRRTDLIGLAFYRNLEIYINDAYVQIVKGKSLFVPFSEVVK